MVRLIYGLLMMFVCTTQGCISDKEPEGPSLQVGDPLPAFSVELNTGATVSTSSLRGKVAAIVFFNTGCPDCREELPVVQQLYDLYKDNDEVEIVPISREESQASVAAYWEANGLTMPYSAQENRDVYSLFAPSVIPRVYIADKAGIITAIFTDSPVASLETLVEAVEADL